MAEQPRITAPDQLAMLRDEFNTRWRDSFAAVETERDALRKLVQDFVEQVAGLTLLYMGPEGVTDNIVAKSYELLERAKAVRS